MHDRIIVNGITYDRLVYERAAEEKDRVHESLSVRDHGSGGSDGSVRQDGAEVCSCGLVVAEGDDLVLARGHVDPVTKQPVSTVVFHLAKQAYYKVVCQVCDWWQVRPTLKLATACRRWHECRFAGSRSNAIRLRGRGDFLGAALERTGWTVEADDPRAEEFLDRTIELCRKQDKGQINIDTVYETLRREFPLR
jgi:hypothetical protein